MWHAAAHCLPWRCAVKAGVRRVQAGMGADNGQGGAHPYSSCRGWTWKCAEDAQLESGAQLWAPPPNPQLALSIACSPPAG